MVLTLKMEAFQASMEKKFDEYNKKFDDFKASFFNDLKAEFEAFLNTKKEEITTYVDSKREELSKEVNEDFSSSLQSIQKHVKELQDSHKKLAETNRKLSKELEGVQQYVRRQNLRIFGVPLEGNEPRDISAKVLKIMSDANMDIPAKSIDRAHRIGKVKQEEDGSSTQPIIVRFSTFRDRTSCYKQRKNIREKYGVVLDLTVDRLSLLKEARLKVADVESIRFVYSDVNCNLRAFTSAGKHVKFDSLEALHDLIGEC